MHITALDYEIVRLGLIEFYSIEGRGRCKKQVVMACFYFFLKHVYPHGSFIPEG